MTDICLEQIYLYPIFIFEKTDGKSKQHSNNNTVEEPTYAFSSTSGWILRGEPPGLIKNHTFLLMQGAWLKSRVGMY